jgi:hypothetical protein
VLDGLIYILLSQAARNNGFGFHAGPLGLVALVMRLRKSSK